MLPAAATGAGVFLSEAADSHHGPPQQRPGKLQPKEESAMWTKTSGELINIVNDTLKPLLAKVGATKKHSISKVKMKTNNTKLVEVNSGNEDFGPLDPTRSSAMLSGLSNAERPRKR